MWFFYYFNLDRSYDVLKSSSTCFLLSKNMNFNKNETASKVENPTHAFREKKTFGFSSYKNHKLKVKPWWIADQKRKKSEVKETFLTFLFILIYNLQWVYWIAFQNICSFTYQKKLLHKLFYLHLKYILNTFFQRQEPGNKIEKLVWLDLKHFLFSRNCVGQVCAILLNLLY